MGAAIGLFMMLLYIAVIVLVLAGLWKVFVKAGKPGWGALVPIYNLILMLEIAGRPLWWILLFLVPCVSIVVSFIVCIDIAKKFGKDIGFGIGLALLGFIFIPILGFGSAQYQGGGEQQPQQ